MIDSADDPLALVAFLRGELNADERARVRRLYTVLPQSDSVRAGWHQAYCEVCDWTTTGLESVADDAGYEHVTAEHAQHPSLVDIDAKRRILDLYRLESAADGGPLLFEGYAEAYWDVLRLLALPYAAHPDYRETWKP